MTGVALLHPVPSLTLYTDSSLQGWGAFLEGKSASGVWSLVQQQEHINLLEMRAVLLALQHFKTLLVSKAVVLATDNTTVVAYLQNQGGTRCHELPILEVWNLYIELEKELGEAKLHLSKHFPCEFTTLGEVVRQEE
jgi:ribonuclease HI